MLYSNTKSIVVLASVFLFLQYEAVSKTDFSIPIANIVSFCDASSNFELEHSADYANNLIHSTGIEIPKSLDCLLFEKENNIPKSSLESSKSTDNLAATALCKNSVAFLDNQGAATVSASDIDDGSNSDVNITSLTLDNTNFLCDDLGVIELNLTVTDDNNSTSSCSANLVVIDTISPIRDCSIIPVLLDENGFGELNESSITTLDNCNDEEIIVLCDVSLTNLVQNGDFENGDDLWTSTNVDDGQDGDGGIDPESNPTGTTSSGETYVLSSEIGNSISSTDPTICQSITLENGTDYVLIGQYRDYHTCCGLLAEDMLAVDIDGIELESYPNPGTEWAPFLLEFTTTGSAGSSKTVEICFRGGINDTENDVALDNIQLFAVQCQENFDCDDLSNACPSVVQRDIMVIDASGNFTRCDAVDIAVRDGHAPAINDACNNTMVISISSGEVSRSIMDFVDPYLITDNCLIDSIRIRKVNIDPCVDFPDPTTTSNAWDTEVQFCCQEAGQTVMVQIQVWDHCQNTNACMVEVRVEDRIAPYIECPSDVTIDCDYPLDLSDLSAFGNISFRENDRNDIVIEGNIVGKDGMATDNCLANPILDNAIVESSNFVCDQGYITRTFQVQDNQGATDICVQRITILDNDPFTAAEIEWPDDITLTDQCSASPPLPSISGNPTIENENCMNVIASHRDQVYDQPPNGCKYVRRTWTVIDWCTFSSDNGQQSGIYKHIQNIFLRNTNPPIFTDAVDLDFCVNNEDCTSTQQISVVAQDDCTSASDLLYKYAFDFFSDGLDVKTGSGSFISSDIPIGMHELIWRAEDLCGNITDTTLSVTVMDCTKPTAFCINGLSASIGTMPGMADPMVRIWASDFNRKSSDSCSNTDSLNYSFSADTSDTFIDFFCTDVDSNFVEMWVTDGAGNQSYCEAYINIHDPQNYCSTGSISQLSAGNAGSINISGNTYLENQAMLSEVKVTISNELDSQSNATDESGYYVFHDLVPATKYTIRPQKQSPHLLGVSTLDLIIMQKHILGLQKLESPYQIIAADVDHSQTVSSSDIISLRKLILGITEKLPDGIAWKFIPANYEFSDVKNPRYFRESVDVNDLENDLENIDFIAVKMGDLSGNAIETNQISRFRKQNKSIEIEFGEAEPISNDKSRIPVFMHNLISLTGFQMDLHSNINFVDVESGVLEVNYDNFILGNRTLKISVSQSSATYFQEQAPLFYIISEGNKLQPKFQLFGKNIDAEVYDNNLTIHELRIKENTREELISQLTNRPNPFSDETTIEFLAQGEYRYNLQIYNGQGTLVFTYSGQSNRGKNALLVNKSTLKSNSGLFFYRVNIEAKHFQGKMLMIN